MEPTVEEIDAAIARTKTAQLESAAEACAWLTLGRPHLAYAYARSWKELGDIVRLLEEMKVPPPAPPPPPAEPTTT